MPQIALPVALALAEITQTAISVAAVEAGLYAAAIAGTIVAGSALQRSLQPDGQPSSGAELNAPEVKASVKQSTPFQRIIYGPQRFGGAFAFYKAPQGTGRLVIQHMYSRRKLNRILGLNINGNRLLLSSGNFGVIESPIAIDGQPDYPHRLRYCFQQGTLSQPTNPLLRELFPDLPAGWRLPGIANGTYEFQYGTDWDEHTALWGSGNIPDIQPEAEGAVAFDPRDPSQFLPDDPDDIEQWFAAQESWKYTTNAKLLQADFLWQPDGLNAGPDGVRWDKVAEGADRDDEAVATRDTAATGNYEPRYQIAGVITSDQQCVEVFDGLLTASRSTLIQGNAGACWVDSDAPKTPVLTITDDMLMGGVTFRAFKGRHDIANRTTMRFVAPGRQYQLSDGPPLIRADLIAEDGGELSLNVSLAYTPSPSAAQRIAKADLDDVRIEFDENGTAVNGGATWSGIIDLRGLGVREADCVEIASVICPHWNGLYLLDAWSLTLNLKGESGLALALTGYDPDVTKRWDPAVDEQPFELTDTDDLLDA